MKYLVLVLFCLPMMLVAQHSISGRFKPAEDYSYAFLYRATPRSMEYVQRSEVDSVGNFKIELDSYSTAGIYKIVYAVPQDEHYFNLIYNGKEDVKLTFSKEAGLEFTESTENKLWASYTKSMEMVNTSISSYYENDGVDEKSLKNVFKVLKDLQNSYEKNSEGYIAHSLIKANRPYIPKEYEDVSVYARNLKATYLKNLDFNSDLLVSAELIKDKVLTYMFGVSQNTSDLFYQAQLNMIYSYTKELSAQKQLPIYLPIWEQFKMDANISMTNFMIDTYLMEMADSTNDIKLIKAFNEYKKVAIGARAIDFKLDMGEGQKEFSSSLHKLEGYDNYLIIFWSSTCGHCLRELPEVKKLMASKPNIKVIAFGLEKDNRTWAPEILNYPDFIHVLGLKKWNNETVIDYSVKATPSYFLLNKDKYILAKPENINELAALLK